MKKPYIMSLFLLSIILILGSCKKKETEEIHDPSYYLIGLEDDIEVCSGLKDGNGKLAHVLILVGQSNCTGCSITEYLKNQIDEEKFETYSKGYENIHINFNIDNHRNCSNGEFRKVDLMCGSYDEEFGPEVGLADYLSINSPDEEFYILKYSMSGYTLNFHWLSNYERGEIYKDEMIFFRKSLEYMKSLGYIVSLDAILWCQGESDTTEYKTSRYYQNQVNFISYLREDLKEYQNDKGIYFIDMGISDSPYNLPTYKELNEIKERISRLSDLNLYFSTIDNGLTTMYEPYDNPDLGHYDSLSEIRLGELFGEYYINYVYDK